MKYIYPGLKSIPDRVMTGYSFETLIVSDSGLMNDMKFIYACMPI